MQLYANGDDIGSIIVLCLQLKTITISHITNYYCNKLIVRAYFEHIVVISLLRL